MQVRSDKILEMWSIGVSSTTRSTHASLEYESFLWREVSVGRGSSSGKLNIPSCVLNYCWACTISCST